MNAPRLIHIHEDDWGLRSLHPLAARTEVRADLDAGIAASERNRDPSGHGWTAMHVIATPSLDFRELVGVEALAAALTPLMPAVPRFYATAVAGFSKHDAWGSYDEAAICYGFDERCFVKVDVVDERVEAIWYECWTDDGAQRAALLAALCAVDALTPCSLVDHLREVEGAVGDDRFMQSYAALLAAEAAARAAKGPLKR